MANVRAKGSRFWTRGGWPRVRLALARSWEDAARVSGLPASSWLILEQLARLMWYQSRHSDSHAAYCVPSEAWVGLQVGRRREAVSHQLQPLVEAGLLEVVHRRQVEGKFQTNLYRLGREAMRRVVAAMMKQMAATFESLQAPFPGGERYVCGPTHMANVSMQALLSRWLARGGAGSAGGHG